MAKTRDSVYYQKNVVSIFVFLSRQKDDVIYERPPPTQKMQINVHPGMFLVSFKQEIDDGEHKYLI